MLAPPGVAPRESAPPSPEKSSGSISPRAGLPMGTRGTVPSPAGGKTPSKEPRSRGVRPKILRGLGPGWIRFFVGTNRERIGRGAGFVSLERIGNKSALEPETLPPLFWGRLQPAANGWSLITDHRGGFWLLAHRRHDFSLCIGFRACQGRGGIGAGLSHEGIGDDKNSKGLPRIGSRSAAIGWRKG